MKWILFITLALVIGCTSTRKMMDSWMGHTKQDVIQSWGPPYSTQSNGGSGEVLTWVSGGYVSYGTTYYPVRQLYFNESGTAYSWRTSTTSTPPTQVNMHIY